MSAGPNATDTWFAMPATFSLSKRTIAGETVVSFGPRAVFVFDEDDRAMRNLSIVALRRAGVSGMEVAQQFGLRHEYISRLFNRATEEGSAGLVAERGALVPSMRQASLERMDSRTLVGPVQRSLGSSVSARQRSAGSSLDRPRATMSRLELADTPGDVDDDARATEAADAATRAELVGTQSHDVADGGAVAEAEQGDEEATSPPRLQVIGEGVRMSRYAGAMLLHGFFDRAGAGAGEVLSALLAPGARAHDAASVMLSATFGFALGSSSAEGPSLF